MPSRLATAVLFSAALTPAAAGPRGGAVDARAPLAPRVESRSSAVVALRSPGPDQILIPASTFTMGSRQPELDRVIALCKKEIRLEEYCDRIFLNELEAHEVMLSAYAIDRTEVTVRAYRRCVEIGRCAEPPFGSGGQRFDRPEYPVTLVTWNDADAYCRFAGGRLPTEAEWERAARGRMGREFPWGNLYNEHLSNHGALGIDNTVLALLGLENSDDSDGFLELAPVGSFPAGRTPDGIDDLAGNVEEWVADAVDDVVSLRYAAVSEVNPKGAAVGLFRAVRGGSYEAGAERVRSANRSFRPGSERQPYRGFRCVHPAPEGL
ncbi:MAG: SUMF1/EgtB/PvdO family nonheme iron enzyme [Polyangiaceae bacterium]